MLDIEKLTSKVKEGYLITRDEAIELYENNDLDTLCDRANEIRKHYRGNVFDICTIVNAKCGRCSENCKFCAQSAHNPTHVESYPLLSTDEIVEHAKVNDEQGVLRYSIVTSGRKLSDGEVDKMCDTTKSLIEHTSMRVCGSFGLLNRDQFARLKEAGISRIHNNLETSRSNFPNICTTHTFDDKIRAIKDAMSVGLNVCSGGIMGLGESHTDRIDMALTIRELGVKSVPVNMLNPIKGTPFENNKKLGVDDMRRIVAVFRFIIPDAFIRLAGGRGLLEDKGRSCFLSGANAAISGDMLTTQGITVEKDMKMLKDLGYEVRICND